MTPQCNIRLSLLDLRLVSKLSGLLQKNYPEAG